MYIIYGSPGCSACDSAKQLLTNKSMDFAYVDLEEVGPEEMAKLMKTAGVPFRTVPQIFHRGFGDTLEYVGGFTQLQESFNGNSE